MSNFKVLRLANKLTLAEISDILKISPTTYSQWENNKREPDISMLIKIADLFKVSIDYLVGREFESSDELHEITSSRQYILNKDIVLSLFKKIPSIDSDSLPKLEGYIDGLIALSKK